MNEITWALIQLMDGEMKHDLQSKTGLPQEDCDRIWNAYQLAIKDVKVHEVIDNFVDSQVPMDSASPTRSHEKAPDQGFAAPQPVQIDQKPWKVGYWLNPHNKLWVYNHQGNCSWKLLDVELCEKILEAFHHPDIWCLPYWAIKSPPTLY